ncbi:MAG: hypothetical protein COY42_35030 [Armatimonadetes bacterium CG_4_10_14_0_8_um_filter_66_14]|nr:hypothetical protein [Armatimonadota bacterium]OIO95045.1 MAG: hypothetical protein AUJ96_27695 [Armatimonadetes bacterium CG2_30_66_41]PIU66654.1 MAG: hypothetical protein COS85_03930 [Armatimonadetes bacterium CG07_land_8_20_14_0_80_59_28]PIU92024.1 MAG: hypothetical protein COS65_19955 [Armatimonadetes bacterium CG06_land_8_20_14_3_00_66_21]PIZ29737.1 MAG: hypothetical protein COY42_35030 [Armatimonadetes bacterium CG_4_10_14_0_8_um_filter_66_14]PJB64766.1 MAG: hypothetical protein CO096
MSSVATELCRTALLLAVAAASSLGGAAPQMDPLSVPVELRDPDWTSALRHVHSAIGLPVLACLPADPPQGMPYAGTCRRFLEMAEERRSCQWSLQGGVLRVGPVGAAIPGVCDVSAILEEFRKDFDGTGWIQFAASLGANERGSFAKGETVRLGDLPPKTIEALRHIVARALKSFPAPTEVAKADVVLADTDTAVECSAGPRVFLYYKGKSFTPSRTVQRVRANPPASPIPLPVNVVTRGDTEPAEPDVGGSAPLALQLPSAHTAFSTADNMGVTLSRLVEVLARSAGLTGAVHRALAGRAFFLSRGEYNLPDLLGHLSWCLRGVEFRVVGDLLYAGYDQAVAHAVYRANSRKAGVIWDSEQRHLMAETFAFLLRGPGFAQCAEPFSPSECRFQRLRGEQLSGPQREFIAQFLGRIGGDDDLLSSITVRIAPEYHIGLESKRPNGSFGRYGLTPVFGASNAEDLEATATLGVLGPDAELRR